MRLSLVLFLSVVVSWCCVAGKKQSLPQECLKEYKKIVSKYSDEEGHCVRLQVSSLVQGARVMNVNIYKCANALVRELLVCVSIQVREVSAFITRRHL
jgi:hypothetical protein